MVTFQHIGHHHHGHHHRGHYYHGHRHHYYHPRRDGRGNPGGVLAFLAVGIMMICTTDGAVRIVGIVLTAVGALGLVLLIVIVCDYCVSKWKHYVSHFQY